MRSETTLQRAAGNTQFNAAVSNLGLAPEKAGAMAMDTVAAPADAVDDVTGALSPSSPERAGTGRMSSAGGDQATPNRRSMLLPKGASMPRSAAAGAAAAAAASLLAGSSHTQFSNALASLGIGPEMQCGFSFHGGAGGAAAAQSTSPPQGLQTNSSRRTSFQRSIAEDGQAKPASTDAASEARMAAGLHEHADAAAYAASVEQLLAGASEVRARAAALQADLPSAEVLSQLHAEVAELEESTVQAALLKRTVADLRDLASREEQMRNDLQVRIGGGHAHDLHKLTEC